MLPPSDEELLKQYQQTGDPALIGKLYERYSQKVLGVCLYYLKDEQAGKDAAADIFINLLENGRNYHIQHFDSWLYRVTRNHCIKHLQKQLSRPELSTGEFDGNLFVENDQLETLLYREAVLDQLCEAIEELNDSQRSCIVRFYLQGQSYREIEQQTTFSANEIKSHLQNGRRMLRKMLSEQLGQID